MNLFFLNEDVRIIDQIRKGDEEALVTLYRTNERQISAFVASNSGTRDDAEDLLQEALVILWEKVRTGCYEHTAKISTFVFGTVKNLWLRRLARSRREIAMNMELDPMPSNDRSALEEMIESEESIQIADALDTLGDPCRKLLLLFYWEEVSMDEIARRLGFANADTAKSKKYQCKKALQKLLKGLQ